ncbi:MAG: phage major capsid protein [Candidatus Paceibacterota bacterium]|jgi:HK97 family phage major capsid protein
MADYAVKLIAQDDKTVTVAGYGVVFGGRDLEGETFTKDTDFMLTLAPTKPIYYDHALQPEVTHPLGETIKATIDDVGIWVEAQLQRSKRYVSEVLKLVEEGVIGWSSGSVGHLVQREGKSIKRWPIIEFSLTPTPAEPRTLGVERLKTLAAEHPELKALLPQVAGDVTVGATERATNAQPIIDPLIKETKTMNEVTMTMEEYKALLSAQVKAPDVAPPKPAEAQDPAMKALSDRLEALTALIEKAPALKDAGYVAPDSEEDHSDTKSFGDFLIAIRNGNTKRIKSVYKTALAEDAGATGGYLVPTQFVQPIMAAAEPFDVLRRAGATVVPMNAKGAEIPTLDIATAPSAGDTAYAAGVVAYWGSEAADMNESEPRFRMIELVNHALNGYSIASNEVRADAATSVEALLTTLFGRAIGSKSNYAFFRGDGVGKPLGIMNSPALISASRSAASTVALADLAQMMSDLLPGSWGKAAWFVNPSVIDQIIQLVSAPLSWMENMRQGMPVSLLGLPLYVTGALPVLNTVGDILLVDPSYYLIGDRQGIDIAYSEHYKFISNQGTWRFNARLDGQPWLSSYVTLEDAATTVSPFVALLGA